MKQYLNVWTNLWRNRVPMCVTIYYIIIAWANRFMNTTENMGKYAINSEIDACHSFIVNHFEWLHFPEYSYMKSGKKTHKSHHQFDVVVYHDLLLAFKITVGKHLKRYKSCEYAFQHLWWFPKYFFLFIFGGIFRLKRKPFAEPMEKACHKITLCFWASIPWNNQNIHFQHFEAFRCFSFGKLLKQSNLNANMSNTIEMQNK